ncbi:Cadmium/zinc-transporting ATPase HMA2 [Zea mays]|uniref:Cd(2+)-exporting ATPase n=1 Tax=Zea mays TaxID=4577 RepID=A0A1D6EL19_MAIZE|nr:Cadmium/zinc-transporting ATPase HMA2 [Zea mays]
MGSVEERLLPPPPASGAKSGKWEKTYLDVLGVCCSAEVALVERLLKPIDGVRAVTVVVPSRTVIVEHDLAAVSQSHIVKALNKAGLEASVRAYGSSGVVARWPSPYTVASGALLLASLFAPLLPSLRWLALAAACAGAPPMVLRALAAGLALDINALMLVAVAGAAALGDYAEAGAIVFLFTTAEWLETLACTKASAGMSSLMSMVPPTVVLAQTGEVVGVRDVGVGAVVAVRAGEVVPVDGVVVDGQSEVDESSLTGESFPVPKQPQAEVWAGTMNLDGYIAVRTTALADNSTVARMQRLVEAAQNSRSKTQRLVDSCAKYYTPAVVAVAAGVALVPLLLGPRGAQDPKRWFQLALVLLVSACPCALVLSTPVATFCALLRAARMGVLTRRRPGGGPLGAPPGGQGRAGRGPQGEGRADADGRGRHERRAGAGHGGRGRRHGPVGLGGRHGDEPRHAHVQRPPPGARGRPARAARPRNRRRQRDRLRGRQGRRPRSGRRVAPRAVGGRARRRRHVPARRAAQHAAALGPSWRGLAEEGWGWGPRGVPRDGAVAGHEVSARRSVQRRGRNRSGTTTRRWDQSRLPLLSGDKRAV